MCAAGEIDQEALNQVNPYVIGISIFAIAFAGAAGSAVAIYKEVRVLNDLIPTLWAGTQRACSIPRTCMLFRVGPLKLLVARKIAVV